MKFLVFVLLCGSVMWAGEKKDAGHPPGLVKVNGRLFSVSVVGKMEGGKDLVGRTDCKKNTIVLLKEEEPIKLTRTFIHEVLHAFGCRNGVAHDEKFNNATDVIDPEMEHEGIYWAAEQWAKFLYDNPEAFKWMLKMRERQRVLVEQREEFEDRMKITEKRED